jgi:peroxiredoxin
VHVGISSGLSDIGAEVLTDTRGRYDISAIPPEQAKFNYRVSVYASGYGSYAYRPIKITGQPGKPVELERLVLQSADQSVSGMVVDVEGKPAARVPVFLHGRGQPRKNTATDENGRFTITRICKGEIRLQANFEDSPGGEGFLKAQGGDQDVKIILGQRQSHTKDISLIGKPLPELKEFKIQLSPADVKDRMILVCFWDMNQRPSRQCITKLAEQAGQLKEKGITIIAIQSAKVEKNALDEWIKKYNISFAVGMIAGKEEEVHLAWGVKALPWLILTDRKHVVIAEGFALSELDEKIKQVSGE